MTHDRRTKKSLIEELDELRLRVAELETLGRERRCSEQALRESHQRNEAIYRNASEGILVADIETKRFLFANPAICKMLGYSEEELKQLSVADIHPPDALDYVISEFEALARREILTAPNIPCLRANGTEMHADISTAEIIADGRRCSVRFFTDVSGRWQAEETLAQTSKIISRSPAVVFLWKNEENWPVEFVTDNVESLFGYTAREFCEGAISYEKVVHPDDLERVAGEVSTYSSEQARDGFTHEPYRIIAKDGVVKWVSDVTEIRRSKDGRITHYEGIVIDITGRKQQAEKSLRESEERYHRITEAVTDYIYTVRIKNGRPAETVHNQTSEAVTGHSPEEFNRDPHLWIQMVPEEDRDAVRDQVSRILSGDDPEPVEHRLTRKDGCVRWVMSTLVANRDRQGNLLSYDGLIRDITERKRAEETLKQSAKNYRDLFNNATDAIYIQDKEGHFLDVNQGAVNMYGYPKEFFIGKTPGFLSAPGKNDMKKIIGFVEDAFNGKPRQYDFWGIRKSGEVFPKIVRSQRGFYQGQKVIITFALDITERKQAEEALRKSEGRYQELFTSLLEGVGVVNENEELVYCNPAYARIFEEDDPESMVGVSLLQYVAPDQQEIIRQQTDHRKMQESSQYELEIVTANNNRKIIHVSVSPRFSESGAYVGAFGNVVDITETKRLQALESRAERLETAGTIAGQVAHDFNNLLAPLMAYPELIRDELPKDHPALAYLGDIETAAAQIADINQQLLTLGRRGHYNQEPLNLNEIVLQVSRTIVPLPDTLTCEVNLSKDLMNILGGGAQIIRVISNLLDNARDAMQDVGRIYIKTENYYVDEVSIAYGRIPKGEYAKLTISDTGCGIPDDIVQRIFDPFFTSKTTDKKRGSGLGLSVVDAVVRDHGGYIDLSSKVGGGTSFYLYFPVTRKTVDGQDYDKIPGGTETVLVIDDDSLQRDVSLRLLEKLGYRVSAAESGVKAIEFLKEKPQDLLVLDMIMPPGIDGAETYRRAIEINPDQKAIITSGFSETERVLEAQRLGAGAFLRKPLTTRSIAAAVRKELDRKAKVTV
ncbi:MAG: PAS domain S-box protein [candidate division Zixibacteria bacterium]|nr:PAS domain S-box protein [candidate division Zixibacteria bacterium]